jgi:predicted enzyme related to lactoylglutathione lyase
MTAVIAASFELPPLVQPASAEHHVGKVVWTELVTPDLVVAERFYSGLFGWTFREIPAGDAHYAVAYLDGQPVGGLLQRAVPNDEHRQPAWLTFISVGDVDAAKQTALAHGAKVLFDAQSVPQRGRQAVFADPDGAVFAVLASSSGDPPDVLAAPGEWIWSALITHDPDKEAAFYQTLFGYEVFDLPNEDGREHVILSTDNYARASVNALPDDSPRRHPHWLNFVRVADAGDAAAKVVALGGRVLVEPRSDRHGGRIAVFADPSGAPFGVMEWPEADSQQEQK